MVNKKIQKSMREIDQLFIQYNTLYPSNHIFTSDSIQVTNRVTGVFWIDSNVNHTHLMRQRDVIDTWCAYKRSQEERCLIERDIKLLKQHCQDDITILNGERLYNDEVSEREKQIYEYLIAKHIDSLDAISKL